MSAAVFIMVPDMHCATLLPGYHFADRYGVLGPVETDAISASRIAFAAPPRWIRGLMALRNGIVRRFGLKPAELGAFPVLKETPDDVVLGFDDHHLDFRIWVRVEPPSTGHRRISVTTVVRTHNRLGRTYLAVVLPFHRQIVRRMLRTLCI